MASVPNHLPGGMAGLPGNRVSDEDVVIVDTWVKVWRDGIVPELSTKGLLGLAAALQRDDARIITGATTSPPPLQCVSGRPVQGYCPLCYALLDGEQPGTVSVGELEERFAAACWNADQRLGEPGVCRHLLNAIDDWTRPELIRRLLPEVNRGLERRAVYTGGSPRTGHIG